MLINRKITKIGGQIVLFAAIFIFVFLSLPGYSQSIKTENLFVSSYSVEQGLRQSMVSQVCQDHLGLIWMVTGDGLHYFDGQEFRAFRVPETDSNYQADNLMRNVKETEQGTLFVSSTSSILRFNTSTGLFSSIYRKEGYYPLIINASFNNNPLLWISGNGFALPFKQSTNPILFDFGNGMPLPESFYPYKAVQINNREVYIAGDGGILKVYLHNMSSEKTFKAEWFVVDEVKDIAKTPNGELLVLAGNQIYNWHESGKLLSFFKIGIQDFSNMFVDSRNQIWLTNRIKKQIYRLNNNNLVDIKFQVRNGNYSEVMPVSVISIFEDIEHNLWFGTDGNGVLLYSPQHVFFPKANTGFTRCIAAVDQSVWVGTYNNGLWKYKSDLSEGERINEKELDNSIYFLDILSDEKGRVWLATRLAVYLIDKEGQILWKFPINCQKAKFLKLSPEYISLSADNQMYSFHNLKTPVLSDIKHMLNLRAYQEIKDFCWMGSEFGLFRIPKSQFENIVNNNSYSNFRLTAAQIYDISYHDNTIRVATGIGVQQYKPNGTSSDTILLNTEVVYSVAFDSLNRMWYSGNRGMGCLDISTGKNIGFNIKNNIQSLEFNHNASLQTSNGLIYFGGINGVNCVNPRVFSPESNPPAVKLLSLFVSDSAYSSCLPMVNAELEIDRLSPHISGRVFTTDYMNSGANYYSFFLEGYQLDYSKPTTSAEFVYRNLPPGNYRLFVKSSDTFYNWSEPECLLTFVIKPPFYSRWWFILLLAASIIAITIPVVKRIQKVRYQRKINELEHENAIERERLRISKDMHDEVGASLTRISILSQIAKDQSLTSEKTSELIEQISTISGNVVDEMSEIIWAMNPRNDSLDSFVSYIRQYTSNYLEMTEIAITYHFPENIPTHPMSSELRRNLFLIIKESFHNIVKHSQAQKAKLTLHFSGSILFVEIEDNGKGFSANQNPGHGNGLINMRKRMEEICGSFSMTSEAGKGTKIALSVDIAYTNKSHEKGMR